MTWIQTLTLPDKEKPEKTTGVLWDLNPGPLDLKAKKLQGVLALCEFHYCEFHYCGFSKLSRYISKNLAKVILWAIYFVTAYIHD